MTPDAEELSGSHLVLPSAPCSINSRTVSSPSAGEGIQKSSRFSCPFKSILRWSKDDVVLALTFDDARCKGVLRLPSCAVTSAPCAINSCTVSALPEDDARCKGVDRVSFCAETSAPRSIKSRTVSAFPRDDAICKGVEWVISSAVTSAP
ncbi:hypothetical protein EDB92DRAFT_273043 [Lactarius akahatsu]|uniref:Uncharacterized protein n=1 Tax=Lactarius akahatsu TaxID=416441 RepID=A0AAD4Q5S5_9AGAM|nr:hypothetical protein EDB92DRAFT_273043 [Lactarius akahatsu]